MTHTYAKLPVSYAAFDEIYNRLLDAGYHHCFLDNGAIDMHGLALINEDEEELPLCLMGTDILQSTVRLTDTNFVPLGDVVREAFNRMGVTVKQWNILPATMRDAVLIETVVIMRNRLF